MGISSERDDPSATKFHVSMSNFLLGENPIIVAESPRDESEPTSAGTSATPSDETSEISSSEPNVVLIPVVPSEESLSGEPSTTGEKMEQAEKGDQGDKDSNGDGDQVICEKKKKKQKAKDLAQCSRCGEHVRTSAGGATTAVEKKPKVNQYSASRDTKGSSHSNTADNNAASSTDTAEASTEATNAETIPSTSTDWSMSEDALLRGMKQGGETWAEIAKAMHRSKSDVRARWKVVENQPQLDGDDEDEEEKEKPKKKGKQKEEQSKKNKGKGKCRDNDPEQQKCNKPDKESRKKKEEKLPSTSSDTSSSSSSASDSPNSEQQQQQSYLHAHIHNALYPPRLTLKPDAALSPSDCEVLATADARYHAGRWLEMQANFYNATGRWVPLHVIRERCEVAEEQRLRKAMQDEEKRDELVKKIMGWMSGVES